MRRFLTTVLLLAAVTAAAGQAEFLFETRDGVTVYGDIYESSAGRDAPVILLFHQGGGDARGEYASIAARLKEVGYNAIAIDQRRGGERFGGVNRTVAALGDAEFSYCDVYPDLEGALDYARRSGFDGPLALWGSSYSATLGFRLAAERRDEVNALLAFSPAAGPPMAGCQPDDYLDAVEVPVLALRPASEAALESVQTQLESFAAAGIETYVADPGVHGSSMLNEERVGADVAATWAIVHDFLARMLR